MRAPLKAAPVAPVSRGQSLQILVVSFDGIEAEGFVIALDLKGVACSTGAACSSGSIEPSHVLAAIGKTKEQARSSIRFSFGRYSAPEDIDYALEMLPGVATRLRAMSPNWEKAFSKEAVSHERSAISCQLSAISAASSDEQVVSREDRVARDSRLVTHDSLHPRLKADS